MNFEIGPLGDRALLLSFASRVDPEINHAVQAVAARLDAARLPGVFDVAPAFCTVGVHYDPVAVFEAMQAEAARHAPVAGDMAWQPPFAWLAARVREELAGLEPGTAAAGRMVEIPVVYGGEHGPDLPEVAERLGLSPQAVVERHLASAHRVYMLGFTPGLPFIGGLDPTLVLPRRSTPRTRVPAGTVAIAREQSVIYSYETPGGWNLIGRTPLALFDVAQDPPCRLLPGDRVRFVPIDAGQWDAVARDDAWSPR